MNMCFQQAGIAHQSHLIGKHLFRNAIRQWNCLNNLAVTFLNLDENVTNQIHVAFHKMIMWSTIQLSHSRTTT